MGVFAWDQCVMWREEAQQRTIIRSGRVLVLGAAVVCCRVSCVVCLGLTLTLNLMSSGRAEGHQVQVKLRGALPQ